MRAIRNFLPCFACLLLLFGCVPLRQSQVDAMLPATPASFSLAPVPTGGKVDQTWWKSLDSSQLNALIAKAFAESPDLDRTFAHLLQQQALIGIAHAAQTVQASVNGAVTREKQLSLFSSGTGTTMNGSFAASYEIDLWNRLEQGEKAAHFFTRASREDVRTAYIMLSGRIAETYVTWIEQNRQFESAATRTEIAAARLRMTEKRYRQGLAVAEDIYRARQAQATAARERSAAGSAVNKSRHELAALTATFPADFQLNPKEDLPHQPALPAVGLPSDLLLMRPDLRRAFYTVHARDAQVAQAIAAQFPSFSITAAVGGAGLSFGPVSASGAIWKLAMQAAMPLLDGGRIDADIDRNKAVLQEELAMFRSALFTAVKEVEDALALFRETGRFLKETQDELASVRATVALIKARYASGLTDALDLLNGREMLEQARSRLFGARKAHLSAYITLVRSLGGNWPDAYIRHRESTQKRSP